MPPPARTWFLPAVHLLHTACWEARTPACSRPHHTHTGTHPCAGSLPHEGALAHRVSLGVPTTHAVSSPCGAPFTHGVPGSTYSSTPVTKPLAHGGSFALGVALTHALLLPVCVRRSTHLNTLVYTHRDTTHTGTTLATTHMGTLTLGTTLTLGILASTRAPGVFIPPKLLMHPSAAFLPSTSRGTTEFPWS